MVNPLERLEAAYAVCLRVDMAEIAEDDEVFFHEGTELLTQLQDRLAVLPELKDLSPKAGITKADVGVEGKSTPEMGLQLQVSYATSTLIELSDYDWASHIVLVLKKNGKEISGHHILKQTYLMIKQKGAELEPKDMPSRATLSDEGSLVMMHEQLDPLAYQTPRQNPCLQPCPTQAKRDRKRSISTCLQHVDAEEQTVWQQTFRKEHLSGRTTKSESVGVDDIRHVPDASYWNSKLNGWVVDLTKNVDLCECGITSKSTSAFDTTGACAVRTQEQLSEELVR
ncbi:hypothetical protein PI125_g3804 [Phytophthora idaei]|nr:hypothetical protein PI125_g3804 [Phytophthora idaei]